MFSLLLFLLVFSSTLSLTIHNATCLDPRTINVDLSIRSSSSKFIPHVESLARQETSINKNAINGESTHYNTRSVILSSLQSHIKPTKQAFNYLMKVTAIPLSHPPTSTQNWTVLLNRSDGNGNNKQNLKAHSVYQIEEKQTYQSRQNRLLLQEVQDGQKKITNLINEGEDDSWVPAISAAVITVAVFSISVFACCIHCYPCCNQEMYIDST